MLTICPHFYDIFKNWRPITSGLKNSWSAKLNQGGNTSHRGDTGEVFDADKGGKSRARTRRTSKWDCKAGGRNYNCRAAPVGYWGVHPGGVAVPFENREFFLLGSRLRFFYWHRHWRKSHHIGWKWSKCRISYWNKHFCKKTNFGKHSSYILYFYFFYKLGTDPGPGFFDDQQLEKKNPAKIF